MAESPPEKTLDRIIQERRDKAAALAGARRGSVSQRLSRAEQRQARGRARALRGDQTATELSPGKGHPSDRCRPVHPRRRPRHGQARNGKDGVRADRRRLRRAAAVSQRRSPRSRTTSSTSCRRLDRGRSRRSPKGPRPDAPAPASCRSSPSDCGWSPSRCARCPTSGPGLTDVEQRYRQRYVDRGDLARRARRVQEAHARSSAPSGGFSTRASFMSRDPDDAPDHRAAPRRRPRSSRTTTRST